MHMSELIYTVRAHIYVLVFVIFMRSVGDIVLWGYAINISAYCWDNVDIYVIIMFVMCARALDWNS